ncbi:MAG: sensor histidine kinase [Candidatus Ornithomonoglobus sp.]
MSKELFYAAGLIAECVLVSLIMRSFTSGKRASNHNYIPFNLIVLALSVAIVLVTVDEALSGRGYVMLYLMLLVINIAAFATHEIIVLRSREMQEIIDEKARVDSELEGYKRMYEKYENTRILRHDLKEQISTLKSLIAEDKHEALKYADKLGRLGRELDFVEYTDNKVLNILLDRKVSECHEKGIELYIKSNGVSVSFLSELDTVAIFSNLINNAMESCVMSDEKNIFIDFTTLNDAFTVIKVENNCDIPPRCEGSALITGKENAELHGIGMKSVESSVKSYNGNISWSYDSERRFFTVVVMFNI